MKRGSSQITDKSFFHNSYNIFSDLFCSFFLPSHSAMIGLIGAAIPLGILYVLYEKIILYIGDKFKFISNMIQFLSVDQVFHTLVPVALLLGVGIGFIGSRITIRKHLKV